MFRLLTIISLIQVSCTLDANVPLFCLFCTCTNNESNNFEVTCTNQSITKEQLFANVSWYNVKKNESYSYENLTIHDIPLVDLDKQFPESDLKILNLAQCSITKIEDNIFSNLQLMEVLILSDNNIEVLHPDAFKGRYSDGDFDPLKSLKVLKLDHNKIHSLNDNIFEHTSRVEILDLSHNPFKILDHQTSVAITSLTYLKNLDLSHTGLNALPDHFMHTPKYIEILDLSGNMFEKIPETLGESHNLKSLFFNSNPITNLTAESGFLNISTLKSLHMRNMDKLRYVGEGSLSKLENLEELYLYDNIELSFIHKAALSARSEYERWPPIKKLYLQNNRLTSIDMHLLLNWKALTHLDLTENPWTCECENQWMVDELIPIYLTIDEDKAKALRCAAPIEMKELTFYEIFSSHHTMRCLDYYDHRPERDGALLVGVLAGVLVTIPLVLFIIYSYQRNWFGVFDTSAAAFSRQFYRRTQSNDEYP